MSTPSLSRVSPTSYTADTSNHSMQLFGSNFQSGDTLTFIDPITGGTGNARPITFVNSGEIDYQFNDNGDSGTWYVQVDSSAGNSSYVSFNVALNLTTTVIESYGS